MHTFGKCKIYVCVYIYTGNIYIYIYMYVCICMCRFPHGEMENKKVDRQTGLVSLSAAGFLLRDGHR